jgi:hypothetical protein
VRTLNLTRYSVKMKMETGRYVCKGSDLACLTRSTGVMEVGKNYHRLGNTISWAGWQESVGSLHAKQDWIYMKPKRVAWLGKIRKYILVEWRDETRSDIFNIGF